MGFQSPQGKKVLDRVSLFTNEELLVVDYKLDWEGRSPELQAAAHQQVAYYVAILRELGWQNVSGWILALETSAVIQVV